VTPSGALGFVVGGVSTGDPGGPGVGTGGAGGSIGAMIPRSASSGGGPDGIGTAVG
jgi:hypothetical protein